MHVILVCGGYDDIRTELFDKASAFNIDFIDLSRTEKFRFLFSEKQLIRVCA